VLPDLVRLLETTSTLTSSNAALDAGRPIMP